MAQRKVTASVASENQFVRLEEIQGAERLLVGITHHTGLLTSNTFSKMTGSEIHLKAENMQRTGSFKLRGGYVKIASLTPEERKRGVIAASAGNHAQGVAVAARVAGIGCTVVMPQAAALAKVMATKGYGAKVILHGQNYDEAFARAEELAREQGGVFIHAFEDRRIIAGQGTVGLEIITDLPDVDAVVVPVGGGGLISGIAVAVKELRPATKVYGVQASGANSAMLSLRAKEAVCSRTVSTIADGIAIKCCGELTLAHMRRYVDDIVQVEDEDISQAMVLLLERTKLVVEGAGATGLAAVLSGRLKLPGQKVAVVLSGGNVDINVLARLIEHGLSNAGRYLTIRTCIVDQPGELHGLTRVLSELRVNILQIEHYRTGVRIPVNQTEVELMLETQDFQHGETIIRELERAGYAVRRNF